MTSIVLNHRWPNSQTFPRVTPPSRWSEAARRSRVSTSSRRSYGMKMRDGKQYRLASALCDKEGVTIARDFVMLWIVLCVTRASVLWFLTNAPTTRSLLLAVVSRPHGNRLIFKQDDNRYCGWYFLRVFQQSSCLLLKLRNESSFHTNIFM